MNEPPTLADALADARRRGLGPVRTAAFLEGAALAVNGTPLLAGEMEGDTMDGWRWVNARLPARRWFSLRFLDTARELLRRARPMPDRGELARAQAEMRVLLAEEVAPPKQRTPMPAIESRASGVSSELTEVPSGSRRRVG